MAYQTRMVPDKGTSRKHAYHVVFKIARGVHWRPPNPFNAKGKKITERKYRATSVQQSTIVIKLKKTKKKRKMPKGIGKWTISKFNDSIN